MNKTFVDSCVRRPNQKYINKTYIENMKKADEFFNKWWWGTEKMSFRDMLKKQHSIIVGDTYTGYTTPVTGICPPSLIRDELQITLHEPMLKKEWYTDELNKRNFPLNTETKIKVDKIKYRKCHKVTNTEDGIKLRLPDAKHVKCYIIEMEKILKEFEVYAPNNVPKKLFIWLGTYIHLGVICHPFEKVNFSLIMLQVNFILNNFGFNSISHDYLDFDCFMKPTEEIITSLKRMVQDANKDKKILDS